MRFIRLRPEIYGLFQDLEALFGMHKRDCVITSANDSNKHKGTSKHYKDYAIDLRSHHLPDEIKEMVLQGLRDLCGPGYTVLLEYQDTPNEHYHIQFNPS